MTSREQFEAWLEREQGLYGESKILKLTEFVTANELANMMDISVTQVISTCMSVGKHPQHTAEAQAIQECDASKTLVDRFHRRDQTLNHTHVRH